MALCGSHIANKARLVRMLQMVSHVGLEYLKLDSNNDAAVQLAGIETDAAVQMPVAEVNRMLTTCCRSGRGTSSTTPSRCTSA